MYLYLGPRCTASEGTPPATPRAKGVDMQRTAGVSHRNPLALCYKSPHQRWRAPCEVHGWWIIRRAACQHWPAGRGHCTFAWWDRYPTRAHTPPPPRTDLTSKRCGTGHQVYHTQYLPAFMQPSPPLPSRPADLVLWSCGWALTLYIISRTVHHCPCASDTVAHCGTCSGCRCLRVSADTPQTALRRASGVCPPPILTDPEAPEVLWQSCQVVSGFSRVGLGAARPLQTLGDPGAVKPETCPCTCTHAYTKMFVHYPDRGR